MIISQMKTQPRKKYLKIVQRKFAITVQKDIMVQYLPTGKQVQVKLILYQEKNY